MKIPITFFTFFIICAVYGENSEEKLIVNPNVEPVASAEAPNTGSNLTPKNKAKRGAYGYGYGYGRGFGPYGYDFYGFGYPHSYIYSPYRFGGYGGLFGYGGYGGYGYHGLGYYGW